MSLFYLKRIPRVQCLLDVFKKNIKGARKFSDPSSDIQENQVSIDNYSINYVKAGRGSHHVLFLPGCMGTVWTDFLPQLEGMDKNKYTLVFIDLPGRGKSLTNKDYTRGQLLFYRDALVAAKLMEVLKITKYSVVGWCDGGTTSLILAAIKSEQVDKVITLSAMSYIDESDINLHSRLKDVSNWSYESIKPLENTYGHEHMKQFWLDWYDNRVSIFKNESGDMCKNILPQVKAKTLIIQGDHDNIVRWEHALCLAKNILHSKLQLVKGGSHFMQLRHPELFNRWVDDFLLLS